MAYDEVERALTAHERRVGGGEEEDHEVRPFFDNAGSFYMYSSSNTDAGGNTYTII